MKKLILLCIILCTTIRAQKIFKFVDNKTDGALDKEFIQSLVQIFNTDIFFETGTYKGDTTINAIPFFRKVITVELHEGLFNHAREKFACNENVQCYHGKSPDIVKKVASNNDGRILFWLDAHYSGNGTALSHGNQDSPKAITAIRDELEAIRQANIKRLCNIN